MLVAEGAAEDACGEGEGAVSGALGSLQRLGQRLLLFIQKEEDHKSLLWLHEHLSDLKSSEVVSAFT